eukprot:UN19037
MKWHKCNDNKCVTKAMIECRNTILVTMKSVIDDITIVRKQDQIDEATTENHFTKPNRL